jgi:Spy/CpxP family protein refolding chaperone
MKLSRIALATLLIAGLSFSSALAQQPQGQPGPGGRHGAWQNHGLNPDEQLKHLTKALNLTDAQQTQIKPLLADRDEQLKALRTDNTGDPKANHAKMRTINQDFESKFQAILTDDQKQKYADFKEQQRQRMEERRQQHQNGNAPAQVPPPTAAPAPPTGI